MTKEQMITIMNNRFEKMNEAGVEALFNIIMAIPEKERWMKTTSPERIAELDELLKKKEADKAKAKEEAQHQHILEREQCYSDFARLFDAIGSVKIPNRYDLGTDEIEAIDLINGNIKRCFPEYVFNASYDFYKYGFLKGTRYAKAVAKKKAKENR